MKHFAFSLLTLSQCLREGWFCSLILQSKGTNLGLRQSWSSQLLCLPGQPECQRQQCIDSQAEEKGWREKWVESWRVQVLKAWACFCLLLCPRDTLLGFQILHCGSWRLSCEVRYARSGSLWRQSWCWLLASFLLAPCIAHCSCFTSNCPFGALGCKAQTFFRFPSKLFNNEVTVMIAKAYGPKWRWKSFLLYRSSNVFRKSHRNSPRFFHLLTLIDYCSISYKMFCK